MANIPISEKNRRELQNALEQYQGYGPIMELTAEVMRLRQTAFAEGLATSLDVVDAQLSITRAQTGRAQAAYDYVVALAALLESIGHSERFQDFEKNAGDRLPYEK